MIEKELEDRRHQALEAFWGGVTPDIEGAGDGTEECIRVATQVKITREMVQILANGGASDVQDLRDIFATAGFEVVE